MAHQVTLECDSISEDCGKALVKRSQDNRSLSLQLSYQHPDVGNNKTYRLERPTGESLSDSLKRLQKKIDDSLISKLAARNKKKKTGEEEPSVKALQKELGLVLSIYRVAGDRYVKLEGDVSISEAMTNNSLLKICDKDYIIQVNPPSIRSLSIGQKPLHSFPVYPRVGLEFCTLDDCKFDWYAITEKTESEELPKERFCGSGFSYTPKSYDVGDKLKVVCTVTTEEHGQTEPMSYTYNLPVSQMSHECPYKDRQLKGTPAETVSPRFRAVSYNLLAQIYSETEKARDLLFAHCPPEYLRMSYRINLLLDELLGYKADLLCLQEVDNSWFAHTLAPVLSQSGYSGLVQVKASCRNENTTGAPDDYKEYNIRTLNEGCAVFYKSSRFRKVSEHNRVVADSMLKGPKFRDILQSMEGLPDALKNFCNVSTSVLQVVVLAREDNPEDMLCVANVHLYFHPDAILERFIQTAVCLRSLHLVREELKQQGHPSVPILFCGDLNSSPTCPAVHLITKGAAAAKEARPDILGDLDISRWGSFVTLESACGYPQYTNYTKDFHGCLDYIFYSKPPVDRYGNQSESRATLKVNQVLPMPAHSDVIQHVALPNVAFPSDHISLACDMEWVDPQTV